jgi:hypothetical protein
MPELVNQIIQTVGGYLPNIVAAVVILIVGWLVALLVAAIVRGVLNRTTLDNRIASWAGIEQDVKLEPIISKTIYYIVMLFVLIAFFQALGLTIVTQPLNSLLNEVFRFAPKILAAGGLLLLAWLIAAGLKFVISKGLAATNIDDRLSSQAGLETERRVPFSETLANVVYWFIFLLFLPAILGALNIEGLLDPVQSMIDNVLSYLPNLLGAALILVVGWFAARIVRQIVTGLLAAAGADNLGDRIGLSNVAEGQTLSGLVGTVVYVLIIIPILIAGLNALQIEAISGPATNMLNTLLNAVPAIFGAMIILGVTYMIARLVAGLITNLLTTVGFNRVLGLIGLGRSESQEGQRTPAEVVGYLVMIGLMLFAAIEAAELLGFGIVADLASQFFAFGSQVVLGVIVFGIGLYLANLASSVISSTAGRNAAILSQAARLAIIVLVTAMALRQMGIAEDIVNLAFGLLLGAVAVAVALAFGLGARDIAGQQLESWLERLRMGDNQ